MKLFLLSHFIVLFSFLSELQSMELKRSDFSRNWKDIETGVPALSQLTGEINQLEENVPILEVSFPTSEGIQSCSLQTFKELNFMSLAGLIGPLPLKNIQKDVEEFLRSALSTSSLRNLSVGETLNFLVCIQDFDLSQFNWHSIDPYNIVWAFYNDKGSLVLPAFKGLYQCLFAQEQEKLLDAKKKEEEELKARLTHTALEHLSRPGAHYSLQSSFPFREKRGGNLGLGKKPFQK